MRKLIASLAAVATLGGVGLTAHGEVANDTDESSVSAYGPHHSQLKLLMRSARL